MSYAVPDSHQHGQPTVKSTAPTERSRRRKAAHSKVRTGCDNCKQRRIKCDEARPTCLRCARSDLICKGYHPPEIKLFELNTENSINGSDRAEQELQRKESVGSVEDCASPRNSGQSYSDTSQTVSEDEVNTTMRLQVRLPYLEGVNLLTPAPEPLKFSGEAAATRSDQDKLGSRVTTGVRTTTEHVRNANAPHLAWSQKICDQSNSTGIQAQSFRLDNRQISRSLQIWGCTDIEIQGLHFFFEKTLPAVKFFSSSAEIFFTSAIPQMSFYESAIKHQVIALGLAHQRSLDPSNSGTWITVAKNYGYALRCLASNPKIEPHIMLSSCLLFFGFEMLCDGPIAALHHLKSGLRMLRDEGISKRLSESASAHISRHLEPIFAQLATMSSTSGALSIGRLSNPSPRPPDLSKSFESLDEANMKFLELFQWTEHGGKVHNVSASVAWQTWHQNFQSLHNQSHGAFSRSLVQTKLLHAHFLMVQFRAEQRATGNEMSWDLHVEEYRKQLDECFTVCVRVGFPAKYDIFEQDKLPGFDLPPGLFPPLWQMAIVCRDPSVRRQAIELLRIHHQRVGHDDECYGVLTATTIMHLEERDLKVNTSADIPVSRRIRLHEVQPDPAGFLRCTISRWPFTHTEPLLVPCRKTSSHRSAFVCSCKSFGIL